VLRNLTIAALILHSHILYFLIRLDQFVSDLHHHFEGDVRFLDGSENFCHSDFSAAHQFFDRTVGTLLQHIHFTDSAENQVLKRRFFNFIDGHRTVGIVHDESQFSHSLPMIEFTDSVLRGSADSAVYSADSVHSLYQTGVHPAGEW